MKKCTKCKFVKSLGEFNKNKGKTDGLNTLCRECSRKRSQQYYRDNTVGHRKICVKNSAARKSRLYDWSNKVKEDFGCPICRVPGHGCEFDFHHVEQETKKFDVSELLRNQRPMTLIIEEINKCTVLCARCHRLVSFGLIKDENWKCCNVTMEELKVALKKPL